MRSCKIRAERKGFLEHATSTIHVTFQHAGTADVDPAVWVLRINLRYLLKCCLRSLQISLQQKANSVIIPALPVIRFELSLGCEWRRSAWSNVQRDFIFRERDHRHLGYFLLLR